MSAYDAVVVTIGPGARGIARVLAALGQRVVLLHHEGPGGAPGGQVALDVPLDTGLVVDPGLGATFGAWTPYTPTRAVIGRGRRFAIPLGRMDLPRLIPGSNHPHAIAGWMRARATAELAQLIGGGQEQRTYRDWVIQHYGAPVWEHLYAGYVAKRFGPGDEVICGVARIHQGVVPTLYAPVGPQGDLAEGVTERRLGVRGVRSGVVETDRGTFAGTVWLDAPPRLVCTWLGDAVPTAVRLDADRLDARDGLEVIVEGGADLPFETHLLDADVPWFRLTRPGLLPGGDGGRTLVAHAALDPRDPRQRAADQDVVEQVVTALRVAGVTDVGPGRGVVRRLSAFHPVWRAGHLTRLRGWVLALEERELVPIGRLGLCAPLDAGRSAAITARVVQEGVAGLREAVRVLVEPPVLDPGERAPLRRFLTA